MSYDLFFRPRSRDVSPEAFFDHFRQRAHYKVANRQAWYQNEDTGVYFVFEHDEAADNADRYPFSFNINFFRPSYFILEAESEVTALITQFGFLVSDPEQRETGDKEYRSEALISGWRYGNEFGCAAAMKNKEDRPELAWLPTSRLHDVWRWNFGRESLQRALGEAQFVPRIIFVRLSGALVTAVVWPDGIPSVLPRVDYLVIGREEFAPRTIFRKRKDTVFVEWTEAEPFITKHSSGKRNEGFDLDYANCPTDIAHFIRGLVRNKPSVSGMSPDQVLDSELVEKYI